MKSRTRKQEDLGALAEQFKNAKTAMVLGFDKLTVAKDQEFRNEVRETGATYKVVKNTLARLAVDGTAFEDSKEHFTGVTSIAWTDQDPVDLSKVISKYLKQEKDVFRFKTGVVDGTVVGIDKLIEIASLPSKDELIGKLLYLLNAPAQRLATVLTAIPRDLATVVSQIGEGEGTSEAATAEPGAKADAKKEAEPVSEEAKKEAAGDQGKAEKADSGGGEQEVSKEADQASADKTGSSEEKED